MLRVELPQLAHRSEAHAPETVEGNGSFVDTLISLLCGIVCNNEQYNKPVGKTQTHPLPQDCFTQNCVTSWWLCRRTIFRLFIPIVNTRNVLSHYHSYDELIVSNIKMILAGWHFNLCLHKVGQNSPMKNTYRMLFWINRKWNINESLKSDGTCVKFAMWLYHNCRNCHVYYNRIKSISLSTYIFEKL